MAAADFGLQLGRRQRGRPAGKVTDKLRVFLAEYLKGGNATRAARAAGFKHPNVAGAKLLNSRLYPNVVAAVREALTAKCQACGIEARDLVLELAKVAFFDPKRMVGPDGDMLPLQNLPEDMAAAIAQVEYAPARRGKGAAGRGSRVSPPSCPRSPGPRTGTGATAPTGRSTCPTSPMRSLTGSAGAVRPK
jgi:hypothetical protein